MPYPIKLNARFLLSLLFVLCFGAARADLEHGLQEAFDRLVRGIFIAIVFIAELLLFIAFLRKREDSTRLFLQFISGAGTCLLLSLFILEQKRFLNIGFGLLFIYALVQLLASIVASRPGNKAAPAFVPWYILLWIMLGASIAYTINQKDKPGRYQLETGKDVVYSGRRMDSCISLSFPGVRVQNNDRNYAGRVNGDSVNIWYTGYDQFTRMSVMRTVQFAPRGQDTAFWLRQPAYIVRMLNLSQMNSLISDIRNKKYEAGRDMADSSNVYYQFHLGGADDLLIISYRRQDRAMEYILLKPWQLMPPTHIAKLRNRQ